LWAALLVVLACPAPPATAGPTPAPSANYELFFELKLLVRDRRLGQRVELDQWAGGRLLMRDDGSGRFRLLHPIEDPWVFRWYPTRDEAKLGAAVAVAEPIGDPYGALAPGLITLAERRHREWWVDDRVVDETGALPNWRDRPEAFWAEIHRRERDSPPPLHDEPVYPFYILGDPGGRVGFSVDLLGRVLPDSIHEAMTDPWLPRGWEDWKEGDRNAGYGYWERARPDWEPRTYPALVAALHLLDWSPLPTPGREDQLRGREYDRSLLEGASPIGPLIDVATTLNPKHLRGPAWSGGLALRFQALEEGEVVLLTGDSGDRSLTRPEDLSVRVWRHATYDPAASRLRTDELQAIAIADDPDRFKLWLRIGYRPASPSTIESGSDSTNERISSRTRR
jgi:hypothetical protein